ncbi:aspartyl-phosphate phosphatase Spo0E family protein [Clostridium fermenticellae]|uniref:Aspartyl-phosphate phosphatase Spo0E family protein n=1 Tax=Clostridium fermenticellae TaxID=2068654 RepID=A0A386H6E5_9CLOT|nr:aspartyl-phosphate phosphatase Spo0E family protein [Clostridium fermenticellae]AYD41184.1 aspartyl-phosphate phosphatase Spo0E family protein [Clostridium fermenticellae]
MDEEICKLRDILNSLIANNAEYDKILEKSRELDVLIIRFMNGQSTYKNSK